MFSTPGCSITHNDSVQIVDMHVPLSPSSIIWSGPILLCSSEGNGRSDVALAMRLRLSGVPVYYRFNSLREGDEHLTYACSSVAPLASSVAITDIVTSNITCYAAVM